MCVWWGRGGGGGREERPTLVPTLTKVDPYGQQMDMLPCIPIEKEEGKKTQAKQVSPAPAPKPLISSTSSGLGAGLLKPQRAHGIASV